MGEVLVLVEHADGRLEILDWSELARREPRVTATPEDRTPELAAAGSRAETATA